MRPGISVALKMECHKFLMLAETGVPGTTGASEAYPTLGLVESTGTKG